MSDTSFVVNMIISGGGVFNQRSLQAVSPT